MTKPLKLSGEMIQVPMKGAVDVLNVLANANQILSILGIEQEQIVMDEKKVCEVLIDLVKKSGLINGQVFTQIETDYNAGFSLYLPNGKRIEIEVTDGNDDFYTCDQCGDKMDGGDYNANQGFCNECEAEYQERKGTPEPDDKPTYAWECAACGGLQQHTVPQPEHDWHCDDCLEPAKCSSCEAPIYNEDEYKEYGGRCVHCAHHY